MSDKNKPTITLAENGPYLVSDLQNFANIKGPREAKSSMALCRCGGSSNKPLCDGTQAKNGFSSAKSEDRVKDQREDYVGEKITIHDNRGICAHAGRCTDGVAAGFQGKEELGIEPESAIAEAIIGFGN